MLKPNFQFIISQANNGCSLLLLILAKPPLLDISCGNIFAVSIVTALTACPFSIKKCAKMSVLYVKIVKNCWWLGATPPDPFGLQRLGVSPPGPRWCPPHPLYKILGCATGDDLCYFPFPKQCAQARSQKFFSGGPVGAHIFVTYMTSNTNLPSDFFDAPFQTYICTRMYLYYKADL